MASLSVTPKFIGVDLGAVASRCVADDGEIVLTSTGLTYFPSLVSYYGRNRLVGEEALPQVLNENTIQYLQTLQGDFEEVQRSELMRHAKLGLTSDSKGRVILHAMYCDEQVALPARAVLATFIAKLHSRIITIFGPHVHLAISLPPGSTAGVKQACIDACTIAGINAVNVSTVAADDALVSCYARKLSAIRATDREQLNGRSAVLIEMGHTHTTAVVVEITNAGPVKKNTQFAADLGAVHFDFKLFDHFSSICKTKSRSEIVPGTKQGKRLLAGCEKIRKLLSQVKDSSVTVENLTESGDITFELTRAEMSSICADLLHRLQSMISTLLETTGLPAQQVAAVEILGGGVRMQVVQAVISSIFGAEFPLGAKLDDNSVGIGCALVAQSAATHVVAPEQEEASSLEGEIASSKEFTEEGFGFSAEELEEARQYELRMQEKDSEIKSLVDARNSLESYVFEMRAAPRGKHGSLIDSAVLNTRIDDVESWLWDNPDAPLGEVLEKEKTTREMVRELCKDFYEATEKDRLLLEAQLLEESRKAEAERAAEGEDEDHDNRKLKKAERMKLAVKNKEEGTELFKGGNFRPAAARYHKALTHCAKFFDLSPDDEKEVAQLKLSLYLNLAQCYIKLDNWDQVIRNCNDALAIEASNAKALFRRASAYEAKKDWEKALADLKIAQAAAPEDGAIQKSEERIKKQIAKEKEKEKKMWGKAFSS